MRINGKHYKAERPIKVQKLRKQKVTIDIAFKSLQINVDCRQEAGKEYVKERLA